MVHPSSGYCYRKDSDYCPVCHACVCNQNYKGVDQPWCPFCYSLWSVVGPGLPEMKAARQLFNVPCNCEFPDEHPVTMVFSRCRNCHGYSIHCETPRKPRVKPAAGTRILCVQQALIAFTTWCNVDFAPVSTKNTFLNQQNCFPSAPIACGNGYNS